ncbi:MAG: site-2 protease family protein [Planctomycetes bacterium]|nr:site-2 protease family protein [Planctomycetota bacterium]
MADPWQAVWAWSWPLGRWLGASWRLHWTLPLFAVFDGMRLAAGGLPWLWWWAALLVLPLAVLVHELGHRLGERWAGARAGTVTLWPLGGIADGWVPPTLRAQLAVAATGPAASAALWAAAFAVPIVGGAGILWTALTTLSGWLALINLIPIDPLDGGRLWRAALWPLLGRRRAVLATHGLGWLALVLIVLWSLWTQNVVLCLIAILAGVALYQQGQGIRLGIDPDGVEATAASWVRWRGLGAWWRERRARWREAQRARDQAELDRLLAKVSAQGLASLSDRERQRLRLISERLRQEQER